MTEHPSLFPYEPKPKGIRIVEECEATGEPFFVLRAKDVLSIMVLVQYQELVDTYRPGAHEMNHEIALIRQDFVDWMDAHPGQVHLPD